MSRRGRELVRLARDLGWSAELTRGGHVRLVKPGCGPVFVASTPSDRRAHRNALATLKREDRRGAVLDSSGRIV